MGEKMIMTMEGEFIETESPEKFVSDCKIVYSYKNVKEFLKQQREICAVTYHATSGKENDEDYEIIINSNEPKIIP